MVSTSALMLLMETSTLVILVPTGFILAAKRSTLSLTFPINYKVFT